MVDHLLRGRLLIMMSKPSTAVVWSRSLLISLLISAITLRTAVALGRRAAIALGRRTSIGLLGWCRTVIRLISLAAVLWRWALLLVWRVWRLVVVTRRGTTRRRSVLLRWRRVDRRWGACGMDPRRYRGILISVDVEPSLVICVVHRLPTWR